MEVKKAVPGIPLAALDAISDPNTRDVLRALVDSHHVRNGQAGTGDERFITAREAGLVSGRAGGGAAGQGGATGADAGIRRDDVGQIVANLQAQVLESKLFKDLGRRLALLDAPLGKVEETKIKLLAAASKALAEFDKENSDLGNGVTDVAALFDGSIKQTRAIKQTLYDASGALPLASAAILDINNVSVDSKSANASKLAGLTAAFNDPQTGLAASRADYVKLINIEATLRKAVGDMTELLQAAVNDPQTGLAASRADYVNRLSLEATARSAVASALNALYAAVIDPDTQLPYSDAMIADDRAINLTNFTALAQQDQQVYAALGTKNRTFFSSTPPSPVAAVPGSAYVPATTGAPAKPAVAPKEASPLPGDVWYDSSDNNKARRWSGTAWVDASDARAAAAAGLVDTEKTVRLSQDNALVSAISTVWAAIGGNAGLIQGGQSVTVNTAGAAASKFEQVQAAMKDGNGNLISSATIKQTTDALVDRSGKVEAKWLVQLDAGGAATGFRQAGFGIAGSSSPNGPTYSFGVRADSFWIAAPGDASGSGAPPAKVPFIVQTDYWTDANGYVHPPGVFLNELFATTANIGIAQIKKAMIGDAEVDTLKIGKNSVTVPASVSGYGGASNILPGAVGVPVSGASVTVTYPQPTSVDILLTWQSLQQGSGSNSRMQISMNGSIVLDQSDSNITDHHTSHVASAVVSVGSGTYTFALLAGNDWHEDPWTIGNWSMTILGVMR
jgi:hypothetical protein